MDSEKTLGLQKRSAIELLISLILSIVGMVVELYWIDKTTYTSILSLLVYVFIIYYAGFGYRRPHGNLLKWTMVVFAIASALSCVHTAFTNGILLGDSSSILPEVAPAIIGICTIAVTYMGGRLAKLKENTVIIVIVLALLLASSIFKIIYNPGMIDIHGANFVIAAFAPAIQWIAIASAYLSRYHSHKDAGVQAEAEKQAEAQNEPDVQE